MTDEHARTGDGSTEDRPRTPDTDDGLIGRPTTPSGYVLSGAALLLTGWLVFSASPSIGGATAAFVIGLGGLIPFGIGIAAAGVQLAERERDRARQLTRAS